MIAPDQHDHRAFDEPDLQAADRERLKLELWRLRLLLERQIQLLQGRWSEDPLHAHGPIVISDQAAQHLLDACCAEQSDERVASEVHGSEIDGRIADLERRIEASRDALAGGDRQHPLDTLTQLFDLSEIERDVLVLCLAPEVNPAFEPLFAYVQDDAPCKYPTPHLALMLFGGPDRLAARAVFEPDEALYRYRLVEPQPPQSGRSSGASMALRIDERVLAYLLGTNRMDERVAAWLLPLDPCPISGAQKQSVEHVMQTLADDEAAVGINLVGAQGAGQRALAASIGRRSGLAVLELQSNRLPAAEPERRASLRLLEREAALMQLGYFIDVPKLDGADEVTRALTVDLVERFGAFRIVASVDSWPRDARLPVVHVSRLEPAERCELWTACIDDSAIRLQCDLDGLAQQFELQPEAIQKCARSALSERRTADPERADPDWRDTLWHAARNEAARPLSALGQRLVPAYDWSDLVLPDDALQQLREIAAQVSNRGRVYDDWGFRAKLSRGRGIAALFAGPSGTGKTMAAEVLAGHLDLDLFRIDLAGVVSKYIGETEKNLRRVFNAAEASGAILFFDEADALFGKRSEVKDSHDRYANIEINYLLQRMEDYRGLAILATNMKSHLDHAFMRRLRFLVDMPFPDADLRTRIWRKVFPADTPVEELDWRALAKLELSGGNIRNVALNGAFAAAEEDTPVRMVHLLNAARREYNKLDKLTAGTSLGALHG